jgi:hypothetical protein
MTEDQILVECDLCERKVHFGRNRYDGRYVGSWGVHICNSCLSCNWDGIVPFSHPRLMDHLKSRGVAVMLNAKGWLDIPHS